MLAITDQDSKTFADQAQAAALEVEKEHNDITHGDKKMIKKIAEAHLREDPKYYTKLEKAGL